MWQVNFRRARNVASFIDGGKDACKQRTDPAHAGGRQRGAGARARALECCSHWRDMMIVGTVYCTNSTSSVGSVSANTSQRGFMRLLLWKRRSARQAAAGAASGRSSARALHALRL